MSPLQPCHYNHEGKVAYHSRGEAERALQTIRRYGDRRATGVKPVAVYLHSMCGKWFLTSSPR